MLTHLSIQNIALIANLQLDFNKGLNILSGETGAGKSIIIDSLSFVLGKRADKSLIRYGEDSAIVSAYFDNLSANVIEILQAMDIQVEDELMLKRSMTLEGKNVCWINGQKVTLGMLKEVAQALVDIYGQHEGATMLDENNHIKILDNYAEKQLVNLFEKHKIIYNELKEVNDAIKKYGSTQQLNQNIDMLEFQIDELTQADLRVGEEDELVALRHKLNNSQNIIQSLSTTYECIEGAEDGSCLSNIALAIKELNKISDFDKDIQSLVERLDSVKIELRDIASELSSHADGNEFDAVEYEQCEARLFVIRKLKKKYGADEQAVLDYLKDISEKYDFLKNGEQIVAELEEKKCKLGSQLYLSSCEISAVRKEQALKLQEMICSQVSQLGMKNCEFVVEFEPIEAFKDKPNEIGEFGCDKIKFLFSANAGQPPKELSKIISGGELSRFMLAVKSIIADADNIGCMVFDEIDTGISGAIANVVAEKLYAIATNRQVLAITHLPQLASIADYNYLITKYSQDNKTFTNLNMLKGKDLIAEIARLIGGSQTKLAISHAQEMLESSHQKKVLIKNQ